MTALKKNYSVAEREQVTPKKGKAKVESKIQDWELSDKASFTILRQWFYLAILEFTTLPSFDGSLEVIAKRLGISLPSVEVATRELESLGLLKDFGGRLVKAQKHLRWGTSKHLQEIRKFHGQLLQKAQDALVKETGEEDFARRLITGIMLTTSPQKVATAKQKLAEFLHELAEELHDEDGHDVYHLSAQLFPLTKKDD